jgi:hypothetical protein
MKILLQKYPTSTYIYQTNRESFEIITKWSKTRKHKNLLIAREDQDSDV